MPDRTYTRDGKVFHYDPSTFLIGEIEHEIDHPDGHREVRDIAEKYAALYERRSGERLNGEIPDPLKRRVALWLGSGRCKLDDVTDMIRFIAGSYNGDHGDLDDMGKWALAEEEIAEHIWDGYICQNQITHRGYQDACSGCLPGPRNGRCGNRNMVPRYHDYACEWMF